MRAAFMRYAFAVALREWNGCERVRPEVRVGVVAALGAVVAPFVVFIAPVSRLYWLVTGRQPPRLFGLLSPQPYVVSVPFKEHRPPELAEILDRPEHQWEPSPGEISLWYDLWTRLAQALYWQPPVGLSQLIRR
jgi:hypothetical protein